LILYKTNIDLPEALLQCRYRFNEVRVNRCQEAVIPKPPANKNQKRRCLQSNGQGHMAGLQQDGATPEMAKQS
jgi:hypothetical protein